MAFILKLVIIYFERLVRQYIFIPEMIRTIFKSYLKIIHGSIFKIAKNRKSEVRGKTD